MKAISISNRGTFGLSFPNGYMLSVSIGPGSYSENHMSMRLNHEMYESDQLEWAVLDSNRDFMDTPWNDYDQVMGYRDLDELTQVIAWLSSVEAGSLKPFVFPDYED